jgi:hypothetical protein
VAYDKFYYVYRLNPDLLEIEYPKDCDCEEPKTFTDILTGYVSTYGDQEAEDDELIGAESLPTTRQGFGVRWRPEWMPDGRGKDLRFADLMWADLAGASLNRADLTAATLRGADLNRADLRFADLTGADLWSADLRWAPLRFADLTAATLRGADLNRADLRFADLTAADLMWADLSDADLTAADLWDADLTGADLRDVRNADRAFWSDTTCPDGSMNVGNQPCSEVF